MQWTIETNDEGESGKSMLMARYDDDESSHHIMTSKLGYLTIVSEFDSHWEHDTHGLVQD